MGSAAYLMLCIEAQQQPVSDCVGWDERESEHGEVQVCRWSCKVRGYIMSKHWRWGLPGHYCVH